MRGMRYAANLEKRGIKTLPQSTSTIRSKEKSRELGREKIARDEGGRTKE